MLLEQALEPPRRDSRVAARILPGDRHGQLERVDQTQLRQFFGRGHGGDHVPTLNRLLKDPVRAAVRGRRCSSPGAGRSKVSLERAAGQSSDDKRGGAFPDDAATPPATCALDATPACRPYFFTRPIELHPVLEFACLSS
jgi:hypothetical protein